MPWHQVVIKHSDDEMIEQLSMQRLIVPFIGIIRKRRAVGASQDDIEVWLCLDDGCDRIYYFSPNTTANLPRQKPTAGCPPWRRDRRHLGISEQRTVERFAVVIGSQRKWRQLIQVTCGTASR